MRALLIGKEPAGLPEWEYVTQMPYDAEALAQGLPVYLYTPGLPEAPGNRALAATLAASQRELKNWGVIFTDGGRKKLVTAQEAKLLRQKGLRPGPGAVMTPLAKEILEGSD